MTERTLSIADLDAFFAKPAAKPAAKPKAKSQAKSPPAPTPAPGRYWIPDAVVLWESSYQCACGNTAPATPELFVRERCGRATRLLSIRSPHQYSLLPRILEQAPPTLIPTCPRCFGGSAEYITQQLTLPFPEEAHQFRQNLREAVAFADLVDSLAKAIEEAPAIPQKVISRETPLPAGWQFIPGEIEFQHSNHISAYIHSVQSDDGPALPHSYREMRNVY